MDEENDPIRAYAKQNAARDGVKPTGRSWVLPFLASVVITALILEAAFYLWGK
ncbi:MAG: hypothetical protein JWO19_5481 [Bryobacterales bacterium]|nr:hypothetical protein [Bryobacterales bacterium]